MVFNSQKKHGINKSSCMSLIVPNSFIKGVFNFREPLRFRER